MIQNYHSAVELAVGGSSRQPRRAGRWLRKVDDDFVAGFSGAVVFDGNNWMQQVQQHRRAGEHS